MGAKGRKKLQRKKALARTGLIRNLSGPHSLNQRQKRIALAQMNREQSEAFKRYFGL